MFESIRQKLRRREPGEPIVIVSGLPRSGTSMMMKMLEAGGVAIMTDGGRDADIDNPKGYFEYDRTKDLEKETDKSYISEGRGKALKVITGILGYDQNLCPALNKALRLPLTDPAAPHHKTVLVRNVQIYGIIAHHSGIYNADFIRAALCP